MGKSVRSNKNMFWIFFYAAVFSFFGPCYTTISLERSRRVKIDLVTNGNREVALDAKGAC